MIQNLPRINDPRGNLTFVQHGGAKGIPFEIARCYWIYDVPAGTSQPAEDTADTTIAVIALSGSFDVEIAATNHADDTRSEHLRDSFSVCIITPGHSWSLKNMSTGAVALVLADSVSGKTGAQTHGRATAHSSLHTMLNLRRRSSYLSSMTEVENTDAYPFDVRRAFYLYDVPADTARGGHAHHLAQQLMIATSGSFDVTLDDGHNRQTYTLNRPYQALYIPAGVWRTMSNFSSGSVCLVLTSEEYSAADYIRDYSEFLASKHERIAKPDAIEYPFLRLGEVNAPYIRAIEDAALRVIRSGRYIGGEEVERLEKEIAALCHVPSAVGVSNGLDALRLILRAYIEMGRIHPGDEVIVPANTYIASVLAVTDNGLKPVFVDANSTTLNMDTSLIEAAITERTRAIMPVHLYGRPCWDERLKAVAEKHGLLIIEDNAQAIGAEAEVEGLNGTRMTGGLGHAAAFSFYPTKNIGALGDAGMVVTADAELAATVRALSNYGSDRRYHNIYAGLNCRLDPIQAAILSTKLVYLPIETAHRREIAGIYSSHIQNPEVKLPDAAAGSVWHQYVVMVEDREHFRGYMRDHGVETDVNYATPPYLQPCYSEYADAQMPVTERIAAECVSLPCSRCTSAADAIEISEIINKYTR